MESPELAAMLEELRRYAPLPFTKEATIRRGNEFYETRIRKIVEANNHGKVVAIDVETGEYEMGITSLEVCDALLARCPNAFMYLVRIGHQTVHRFSNRPGRIATKEGAG
jgi:hypothetical protein